jgi:hypothetical protein
MKETKCWTTKNSYEKFRNGVMLLKVSQRRSIQDAKPIEVNHVDLPSREKQAHQLECMYRC